MPIPANGLEVVHVYPTRDEHEHKTDKATICWCQPEYDSRDTAITVLHHDAAHRAEWGPQCIDESVVHR
jgi:hypothetical protein